MNAMDECIVKFELNAIRLQQAVLCANCEIISDSPHDACRVCGSRSLLPLARVLNRATPVQVQAQPVSAQAPVALPNSILVLTPPAHRPRYRHVVPQRKQADATAISSS